MADGLSQEEKDTLMKVMERAKEFEQTNKEGHLQLPTEGQLYKWTNPLKGWQPRWFYVNHEQGVLHYCMSEEKRKQPPRASLHLWGAVVSPSEEDSQSFIIQGANSECYRLKAANAKDRQSWVSKMRTEVQHANTLAVTPLSPSDKSTVSLSGNSAQSTTAACSDTNSVKNTNNTTTPTKKHGRKSQLSAPLNLSLNKISHKKRHKRSSLQQGAGGGGGDNGGGTYTDDVTVFPGGDGMLDSLTRLQNQQETLIDQLEASFTDIGVSSDNKDILLLKATSYAAVQSVHDTLAMMNIQLTSSGGSPVHNTLSPINAQSPSRRVPLRHKRPMSMVDTSSRSYQTVENDLDNVLLRSNSTVEVVSDRRKVTTKVTSKEAP